MPTEYEVRDESRVVRFTGQELASISTSRPGAPRWTEMVLYHTDSGRYVLSKIGRSMVVHMPGCSAVIQRLNRFVDEYPAAEPHVIGVDFHACVPEPYNLDDLLIEKTRYWALVAEDPTAVVEALHTNNDGIRQLPRMSASLLEQASGVDPDIAQVFRTERV